MQLQVLSSEVRFLLILPNQCPPTTDHKNLWPLMNAIDEIDEIIDEIGKQ